MLLALHKVVMDAVERQSIASDKMEEFLELRKQDFRALLIIEARVGDQIDPLIMDRITEREVAAGRMMENDPTRVLAKAGGVLFGTQRKHEPKPSLVSRLARFLSGH